MTSITNGPSVVSGSTFRGTVKQVNSGDTVVIRGPAKGGPPPERTLGFSGITAPRLARRPMDNFDSNEQVKDEPFAWEAREFLRKKLVGREVCFVVDQKTVGNKKEYGVLYLGKDTSGENLTETLVSEGLVEVRKGAALQGGEFMQKLSQLEDVAKTMGKCRWATPDILQKHVRDIKWNIDNPRQFLDVHKDKEVDAIIEYVRDGCTIRAVLLSSNQYVTVLLTGVKTPMFKTEEGKSIPEPFAEEAKYFTEVRLLQRDVKILFESASNQNMIGTIIHPNGNIAELLLLEGFAHCSDWSMKNVTKGSEKLRAAEKIAKEKKLRLWKDFQQNTSTLDVKEKTFTAKVIEVVNADGLILKMNDGSISKIFLSSIRSPRPQDLLDINGSKKAEANRGRTKPLYDIPYMFEAREFLRKKVVGKRINAEVDYVQPKSNDFPEKTCCTVTINGVNIGEALVGKGLAAVIKYRQNDDQRSSCYDDLLKAEDRAAQKQVGIHCRKDPPILRIADLSGDLTKAKQFLPFLQRAGRCEALVEFVASGSRVRIYIPKETCLATLLLSGIECPRGARPSPTNSREMIEGEPFGENALNYTKELVMQREVEIEIEGMDKGGNFIGWLFIEGVNLSVALIEEGLAKVHFTAEKSDYYPLLTQAESRAKSKKLNIWEMEVEAKKEEPEVAETGLDEDRIVSYVQIVVTEVLPGLQFYAQKVDTGPLLEQLMVQLRSEFARTPPLTASYTPRKGDLCAAKFNDGLWYRASIEKIVGSKIHVFYVDYGNREVTTAANLAVLLPQFQQLPNQAKLYSLAYVAMPKDEDDIEAALHFFSDEVENKEFYINVEYRLSGVEYVSLVDNLTKDQEDLAYLMISEGLVLLDQSRREKRGQAVVEKYRLAQDKAKKSRLNIWKYGDFREDDDKEFGIRK